LVLKASQLRPEALVELFLQKVKAAAPTLAWAAAGAVV